MSISRLLFGCAVLAHALVFADGIPLPEHPRPDWERTDWVNLNGTWDFGFKPNTYDKKILVPFGWGSPLSGVANEADTGYYRREIVVPAAWRGKRVFLIVGAADHDTEAYLDGVLIGRNEVGYVPFEFDLTDKVKWGEKQILSFKIYDPPPRIARKGHWLYGKQGYGNTRGIWQTVYLEARGRTYVKSARLTPHLATSSVTAEVVLERSARKGEKAELELDGRTIAVPFEAGTDTAKVEIPFDSPRLWDLDNPNLYEVTVRFGYDTVKTYFGFREIGTGKTPNGDNYVTLNGKPIYLQLCLDQSFHPEGWFTYPTDESMKEDILLSKRLALSGNRVHIKAEMPRKLYWADKLGLLIQADVPCAWGDVSHEMFVEHWNTFSRMVERDYNHPSIYQWTLFNETWGLYTHASLEMGLAAGKGGRKRAYEKWAQESVRNAYQKAKVLDRSRLVEDNSPCKRDHVETDVNTWHSYQSGRNWEATIAKFCDETKPGSKANYIGGNAQRGEPMMNSECGNVWGYKGAIGDIDFSWDYHLMINAFRRHLKCAGWLYTEHHDVVNEWNGYVRLDRSPKFDGFDELAGMTLADLHRPAALYFAGPLGKETGETLPAGSTAKIPVGVSLVTDAYAGKTLSLERDGIALPDTFAAKSWQCETLWNVEIPLPTTAAVDRVLFVLKADGKEIARNFWCYSTVPTDATMPKPSAAEWSDGTAEVLGGLKYNGFGKGYYEFTLAAPSEGGLFEVEVSSKRKYGKDYPADAKRGGLDYMLGGGSHDRSAPAFSYPQTSTNKFPANVKVYVDGALAHEQVLPDDPADHRGILSWLAQPEDGTLQEAGSYGWRVAVPVPADAVRDGKVTVRLASDHGLAVYGPRFGRFPFGPRIVARPPEAAPLAAPLAAKLADYVCAFNAADDEVYTNAIPNSAAEAYLSQNAPRFECPDEEIERTYYFRWWTYRKHLRHTPDGWVVTEFLPDVGWAGRDNTISCALGHHFREGRWLRDRAPLRDYAAFWLRAKDGGRLNGPGAYVNWIADSVLKLAAMEGDVAFATNLLPALVRNYAAWEKGWNCRVFPGTGTFPMGLKEGLFETTCNYEGAEYALAGDGARPLVNAAMCGEARAIAAIARLAGDEATAARFAAKAADVESALKSRLWDPSRQFFMTVAPNGVRGTVKELNGYAPWYFALDMKGYEAAWKPFAEAEGFAAKWGLTFPERRTPGFTLSYEGHPCQWNGPSWPYATSIALSALGEALRQGTAGARTPADFVAALHRYAAAHVRRTADGRTLPWIDEVQNPDTGDWISRTMLERDPTNRLPERGKDYNHSTFCDLVLGDLVGIRPQMDGSLVVAPLFSSEWAYLRVEDVKIAGHRMAVLWDRDGTRYGFGKGLFVRVDGKTAAYSPTLQSVEITAQ